MFFDPKFRTLYKRLEDAPMPKADGLWIAVEIEVVGGSKWAQDYVSVAGRYERRGPPFRPTPEA